MFLKQIPHPVYHVYLFSHLDPCNEIILGVASFICRIIHGAVFAHDRFENTNLFVHFVRQRCQVVIEFLSRELALLPLQ